MWLFAFALCQPAHAVDLDSWLGLGPTRIRGAGQGDGEAADVVIDSTGHLIAVGSVMAPEGHGTNGYVVALEFDDLTFLWDLEFDAGAVGPGVPDSNDRVEAIAPPVQHELAFCGRLGSPELGAANGGYWVHGTTPDPDGIHYKPLPNWSWARRDGNGSPDQGCLGMDRVGSRLVTAGYSQHADELGRWVSYRLLADSGTGEPAYTWSDGLVSPEERAHAVSAGGSSGAFVVAGTRASEDGDLDGHVRFYDSVGQLVWQHSLAGAAGLDDALLGVVFDEKGGTVTVVGYETEEGPPAERSWLVVQYSAVSGTDSEVNWVRRVGVASGADDVATTVDLDDAGNLVVGGGLTVKGTEVWHLASFSAAKGEPLQTWSGPAHQGDSRILGLHIRNRKLALAGYTHDGDSRVFTVDALEPDRDGDGVPDSPDKCPDDPGKAAPGLCGCGVDDSADRDADGSVDCVDLCPDDPLKSAFEGPCGCGTPDVDGDRDTVFDCLDACPRDPTKWEVGVCGCGVPDTDRDYDDLLDCLDACPDGVVGEPVDEDGCAASAEPPTCGCRTPSSPGWLPALALLLARRRRRPPPRSGTTSAPRGPLPASPE